MQTIFFNNFLEHPDAVDYVEETNDCGLRKTSFSKIYLDNDRKAQNTNNGDQQPKTISRSRSSSIDRTTQHLPSPRRTVTPKPSSINNTWNGRQKQQRTPLNPDLYSPNFNRSSTTRRSFNYDQNGRRLSQSANTSPTKTNLRQELMNVLKNTSNEQLIAREVEKLVKQYGMTSLNSDDEDCPKRKNNKRKDSRPDVGISKIPMPLSHKI